MDRILSDKNLRYDMIEKGHVQARKFTWDASAEKLYKIYKEIMNK